MSANLSFMMPTSPFMIERPSWSPPASPTKMFAYAENGQERILRLAFDQLSCLYEQKEKENRELVETLENMLKVVSIQETRINNLLQRVEGVRSRSPSPIKDRSEESFPANQIA